MVAFDKYAPYGIDSGVSRRPTNLVQRFNDGAIEIASQSILVVFGQFEAGFGCNLKKTFMSDFQLFNACRSRQVQTQAQIDDGSDNGWIANFGPASS